MFLLQEVTDQKFVDIVTQSFPLKASILAAIAGTVFLMAISTIFFGSLDGKVKKGPKFKAIMIITFLLTTIAVMPSFDVFTLEGIQYLIMNFMFIFGLAVMIYETIGTMVVEKILIPKVMALLGFAYVEPQEEGKKPLIKIEKLK